MQFTTYLIFMFVSLFGTKPLYLLWIILLILWFIIFSSTFSRSFILKGIICRGLKSSILVMIVLFLKSINLLVFSFSSNPKFIKYSNSCFIFVMNFELFYSSLIAFGWMRSHPIAFLVFISLMTSSIIYIYLKSKYSMNPHIFIFPNIGLNICFSSVFM